MSRDFAQVPRCTSIAGAIERMPLPLGVAEARRRFWRRIGLALWAVVVAVVVSPLFVGR